jgi:hypothetical protein
VERLGDAQADAGAGPSDDDHGIAEIEAAHARCLACHRITPSPIAELLRTTMRPFRHAGLRH